MANHRQQFCPKGHDTFISGRLSGGCCTCRKEYQRTYNKTSGQKSAVHKWYTANKDHVKDTRYKRQYGISLEEYRHLYDEQKGICPVCIGYFSILVVEHDHKTGRIRGLTCSNCNRAMGLFKDSPVLLRSAARHLEE